MNNDFAEAGGPVSNVWAHSEDSNALSIISLISSNPSIFEKTLRARSLTLNLMSVQVLELHIHLEVMPF
jgi:hypothetical protein